jgi:hypothetical protein
MNRIVHFELPADNPERAVEFYKKSFGWQIQKWPGPQDYWLVTTGADGDPGINGGILRRQHPGAGTCNTVRVPSVDDAVATITKNGGKVAVAKMPIPAWAIWLTARIRKGMCLECCNQTRTQNSLAEG